MSLIDADALESTIQEQTGKCMIKIFEPSVNLILQDIRNAPTVDAEPVKHGRWLSHVEYCKSHNYLPSGTSIPFWCSECESPAKEKTLYCSHCGAKMDGGMNNDNNN